MWGVTRELKKEFKVKKEDSPTYCKTNGRKQKRKIQKYRKQARNYKKRKCQNEVRRKEGWEDV